MVIDRERGESRVTQSSKGMDQRKDINVRPCPHGMHYTWFMRCLSTFTTMWLNTYDVLCISDDASREMLVRLNELELDKSEHLTTDLLFLFGSQVE